MSERLDSQKKPNSDFRKLLQESIEKANPRRTELTKDEQQKLEKLTAISETLGRGENAQNRQFERWLSEDEHSQVEAEWNESANALKEVIRLCKEFGFTVGKLKDPLAESRQRKVGN